MHVEVVVPNQQHVNHERAKVDPAQDQEELAGEEGCQECCFVVTEMNQDTH